jgi:hypothetical protein
MTAVKFCQGKKVYLRPVEQEDSELVYAGKNDPEVRETLFSSAPMTLEQVRAEMNAWTGNKETVLFTICRQEDQQPVGQTALVRIDTVSRALFFLLRSTIRRSGLRVFAGEATRLMVDYSFNVLNLESHPAACVLRQRSCRESVSARGISGGRDVAAGDVSSQPLLRFLRHGCLAGRVLSIIRRLSRFLPCRFFSGSGFWLVCVAQ